MIAVAEQLGQAIEQMGQMQRILESYRNEILTKSPRNFAVLAEGPLEQLRQLQKQIDEHIQKLEAIGTPASARRTGTQRRILRDNSGDSILQSAVKPSSAD